MKKKYLSIFFPSWSIDLLKTKLPVENAHKGVLLTIKRNNQLIVARRCELGKRVGIKEGSTLSLAKAFLPGAAIASLDTSSDFKRLYKAAVYLYKYTPLIGLDSQTLEAYRAKSLDTLSANFFGINLDLTGTDRLYHERDLIKEINQTFLKFRVDARIALAPTLGIAWALSRFAAERISIFQEQDLTQIMQILPVESLRLDPSISAALREVGVINLNLLSQIPRKNLLERYGKESLLKLDQFMGKLSESISSVQLPNNWSIVREFEFPLLNHESICRIVIELLLEVFRTLRAKGKVAKSFLLLMVIEQTDGSYYRDTKDFSFYSATTDEKHLRAIVFPLVENLKVLGPIHLLMLSARNPIKMAAEQMSFDKSDQSRLAKSELLNFFVSKLGEHNVANIEYSNEYIPENSFRFRSVSAKGELNVNCEIRARPSVILPIPEELDAIAILPDSYPARLFWNGSELNIQSGLGPERIEKRWQKDQSKFQIRDYFKIQDHLGRWLWIYREFETQKWFLQGMWI